MSPLLEVDDLTCRFGGVIAVNKVSFTVDEGTVYSVIGPNGAGKTTLFNLISGVYVPSEGTVRLRGEAVHGLPPEDLAKRGMSRTFQNLQLCMNMSALENVMIGAHLRLNSRFLSGILSLPSMRRAEQECREEAEKWMRFAGVHQYVDKATSQMPYGALKRLEIARALTSRPHILLLDEPAAGLNPSETREVEELVHQVAGSGITVLLVEHDMKLIMNVSNRILVMHQGERLFEGRPPEVCAHPDVIAAYLGTDVEELV